jgi:ketoreductase RED2
VKQASEFSGLRVIVTGSSSGIGEATARRLDGLGASVVVNSASSVEAGERVARELSDRSFYLQADIGRPEERLRLIERAAERLGGIDVLVNNAGWTTSIDHRDLDALTEDVFRKTFEVNVFGTWELTKLAMPYLEQSSDAGVVTVTSIAGLRPIGSSIAYAMSKAALNHMVRLLAKSHGPIRFNAVAPGLVATPWTADWDEMHAQVAKTAPLGRSATADDCAEAVLGILRNRYMTGEIVVVDGGLTQVL